MNYKFFDQERVSGFLHVDFPFLVPSHKRVSFQDVTYFVGYSKHGKFIVCHQCDDLQNAIQLRDALQLRQIYKCVVVCLNAKTSVI